MDSLIAEVESLAPRFANGDVGSLDPLAEALSNLLARSRDRDWLTEETFSSTGSSPGRSNGSAGVAGSGIAVTRLVGVLPELSQHCPELRGLLHPADVADADVAQPSTPATGAASGATSGAANDGPERQSAGAPSSSSIWAVHALRPLLQALRVVRNLLAGSAANQDAFLRCGAVDIVATIADRLITSRVLQAGAGTGASQAQKTGEASSGDDGGEARGGGRMGGEAKGGGNVIKGDVTKVKGMGSVSSLSDALASLMAEVGGTAAERSTDLEGTRAASAAATATSAVAGAPGADVASAAAAAAAAGSLSSNRHFNSISRSTHPSLALPLPHPPHSNLPPLPLPSPIAPSPSPTPLPLYPPSLSPPPPPPPPPPFPPPCLSPAPSPSPPTT
ncbi:hypothetical protein CLOP_g473 [Closterium sp. NIES-67]|nr:hypothetical protein CLOP_g473 [Closterium sp. NIES-67]